MSKNGLLIAHLLIALMMAPLFALRVTAKDAGDQQSGQEAKTVAAGREVGQGSLRIVQDDGSIVECPLKHTDVQADVSGFIARVNVTQTFHNPTEDTIEAVYVFPLPHEAAVDDMTMVIGDRKIVGVIKRRDEARQIYQQALMQGQTAALLEQERPNIFTQSVGNIAPGQEVRIEISYVDVLQYDMGQYTFHFPMVVGPRFIPGGPISSPEPTPEELQGKVSPPVANTTRVPDAERISPPVLRPDVRNGHDISLKLTVDAGVPIQDLNVANHVASVVQQGQQRATIELSSADSLPNKDFVVRYAVVGTKPEMAVLAHTGDYSKDVRKLGNGYFMLMIQPKEDERLKKSPPREMVFLVDVSGSMRGDKTAKVRETMQQMLGLCRDQDTVQVVTFASQAQKLFERPVPVNEANIQRALGFTRELRGSGGTQMLLGVKLAIDEPVDEDRVRIIVMLTDGFIGNEAEIIQHVGKHCGDQIRFWTVGIGQSPNMFLIDGVAKQGGGMGKRLGLNDEAEPLAHEVMTRIQRAQLAKVSIDWGALEVLETFPTRIPELWAGRPLILFGRYRDGGRHEIVVHGKVEGEPVSWPLTVDLPKANEKHDVLAKVWARRKIEELMHQTYYAGSPAVEEEVTAIALDYRLMSPYTSFVAVDDQDADRLQPQARPPRRMLVPVPLPEGAVWEGFFGGHGVVDELPSVLEGVNRPIVGGEARSLGLQPAVTRNRYLGERLSRVAGRPIAGGGIAGRSGTTRFGRGRLPAMNRATSTQYFRRLSTTSVVPSVSSFPSPVSGQPMPALAFSSDGAEMVDSLHKDLESLFGAANYTVAAVTAQAEPLQVRAQKELERAKTLQQSGDSQAARDASLRAFFLDTACANVGRTSGQVAAEALSILETLRDDQIKQWIKQQPELDKRLDLVIRNQPIDAALKQVSQAAGLNVQLIPGSVDDAAGMTHGAGRRISYLDLRGAKVSQALDWILMPARLNWRLTQDGVMAGTDRRVAGLSAWVYDVSAIALPTAAELEQPKDTAKAVALAKQAADQFIGAVRDQLRSDDQQAVVWFAPGQLLVFGDPERHQAVARLLANLAEPQANIRWNGAVAELQRVTVERAKQRKAKMSEQQAARRAAEVARLHAAFGWRLLAAAADGRLDDEALTELTIAWNDGATHDLLKSNGRFLVMRSLWLIREAAAALPQEAGLEALARTAHDQAAPFFAETQTALAKEPDKVEAFLSLLYATLSSRSDDATRQKARDLLTSDASDQELLKPYRLLAASLLSEPEAIDVPALSQLVTRKVVGEDLVTLTALACRRAGGEAWRSFRAEARELLGDQPLPGHVVVLVNRLQQDQLQLTRAR